MEPLATSDEATAPILPAKPPVSSLAASPSLGRMVLIGLSVLGLGLAIAFGGYYYGQKNAPKQVTLYPSPTPAAASPTSTSASPTAAMTNTIPYTNTVYGYTLTYPKDLQLQGQGMQITDTTAPDVMITTDVKKATPDPKRVFFITAQDKSLLTIKGKPIGDYTLKEIADMDLAANVANKNTYTATLSPVTKLQPLPKNVLDGYTFTITSKGYETVSGGTLWDLGDYVITEFDSPKYHYVLVYSNTEEMKNVVMSMQFSQ